MQLAAPITDTQGPTGCFAEAAVEEQRLLDERADLDGGAAAAVA